MNQLSQDSRIDYLLSAIGIPRFTRHAEMFPWMSQEEIEFIKVKQYYPNFSDDYIKQLIKKD